MAIQVYCDCGNALSVKPEMAGKKIRCKKCKEVLQIPKVPMDSGEAEIPKEDSDYEVVGSSAASITCPSCGASASPEDTACLACGAELSGHGGLGPLDKIPRPVLFGAIGLILFGVLGFGIKAAWEGSRPSAYATEGMALLNQEDFKGAAEKFEAALTYKKLHKESVIGLALVGAETHDTALLKKWAKIAVKMIKDPGQRGQVRLAWAWVLLDSNDHINARNQAQSAIDDDEALKSEASAVMGLAALKQHPPQLKTARENLMIARDAGSERVEVYVELAKLLSEAEEYTDARSAVEKALKLKDDDPELWLLAGRLRQRTQDPVMAKQAFEKVLDQDEKNATAWGLLSGVYLEEGDLKKAHKAAEKAAKLAPDNQEAQIALGRILLAQDRPKGARSVLELALKQGKSWEALFLLGKAMVLTDNPPVGLRKIREALGDQPENVKLHLEAARIAISCKDGKQAVDILKRLLHIVNKPDYDALVLMAKALSSTARGSEVNDAEIQQNLRDAMAIDATRRDAPLTLGLHFFDLNDPEAAIEAFDLALKDNPKDAELHYYKGWSGIQSRQWDIAIDSLKACLSIDSGFKDAKEKLQMAQEGKFYEENE